MKWFLFGMVCSEATVMETVGGTLVSLFSCLLLAGKQLLLETVFLKEEKLPFIERLLCTRHYAKGLRA